MSANILMTQPKYVPIPNKNGIPISEPDPIDDLIISGKKRRLDHLTWEEKLQRKKLKNRVAAQTSRDRKKAKMDEMDQTIKRLSDENKSLRLRNIELERTVIELRSRNQNDSNESFEQEEPAIKVESMESAQMCDDEHWMGCGIKNGSAVSEINPLPKELKPQSMRCHENTLSSYFPAHQQTLTPPSTPPPAHQTMPFELNKRQSEQSQQQQQHPQSDDLPMNLKSSTDSAALWKIIALCLLYRTCSTTSTPAAWKSLPKVYSQMSQQTLKIMLQKAATELPKLKASQSHCLDQWWGPKQKGWNPAKIPMEA